MTKLKSLMAPATAILLLLGVPSWAAEQSALGIANNDSIYIDGNSFKIVPGKGRSDTSALIRELDAQPLGPGLIVFRSGDKLYMADARAVEATRLGSDRRDYGSDRYGSDRDTSVSAAQAERDWQEYLRANRRYGSDRYGSDRYGSDRYGSDRYGSDRYGSDRDTSVSAAQAERDWQEYLRANRRYGSDRYGSGRRDYASDRVVIDDPEYAQYKLKKTFEANWTASDSK